MNKEYKAVIWLTIIANIIHTYIYLFESKSMDIVDERVYLGSVIGAFILVYLTYFDLSKENRKFLKDIYHSLFTAYLLIAPITVNTNMGMLTYIILVSITLGSWILNKNGCLITGMKKSENEETQKNFIRKGLIKKLGIPYIVVVGGLFYVSRKMFIGKK